MFASLLCLNSTRRFAATTLGLLVGLLLPIVVTAQTSTSIPTESEDTSVSTTTTTSEAAPVSLSSSAAPYKLESLTGDKVFGDFVLGPGKVELVMEPGSTKTVLLNVSNRMGQTKRFVMDIEDIAGSHSPERSVVLLGDDTGPYTLKDFISIPAKKFELDHNKRAIIPVTITIPPDAEPGGRYGSVLVKTATIDNTETADSAPAPVSTIVSRIGTLFFIRIPGDVETAGHLAEFSTANDQTFYERGPVKFEIVYENTGSVHLNPYGELTITNMFGEEVGFLELEPWFTLPDSLRLREVTWNRDFLYGRYTATLKLNRGYDNEIDTATLTFWVIPWKLIVLGLLGLFAVIFAIRAFFRKFELKVKQ